MFKFLEGAQVAIKNDNPSLGLVAGDVGKVWAFYHTEPPAYEVSFCTQSGVDFDALMYEEELDEPTEEPKAVASGSQRSLATV